MNLRLLLFWLVFVPIPSSSCIAQVETDWRSQAQKMVQSQIADRGVLDKRVLRVMQDTPRHLFVPVSQKNLAYMDSPLPIGHDQTISQPYIVALMTELLELKGDEKVLEIGTGSGYQAAVLAQLARAVYTIEIVEPLARSSAALLDKLGYENVEVRYGDGYQGWPEQAPFDRIIVTAAPEEIPPKLVDQLADGGIMVLPVGDYYQELILLTKKKDKVVKKVIIPVRFVPMVKPKK